MREKEEKGKHNIFVEFRMVRHYISTKGEEEAEGG